MPLNFAWHLIIVICCLYVFYKMVFAILITAALQGIGLGTASVSESDPCQPSATAATLLFQESLLQQRNMINLVKTKATENYSQTLCSNSEEQGMGSGTETQGREKAP